MGTSSSAPDSKHYFVPQADKQTFKLVAKDANDWFELGLHDKVQITHDTYKFVFKLPEEDQIIGLPVGGHVFFHFTTAEGEVISRKYTPISLVNEKGVVTFIIKLYMPCDEFPKGGAMSQHLHAIAVGAKVKFEGPKGLLSYEGNGNFLLKSKPLVKKKIGMIAGGSGITPCFQLIQASTLGKDGIPMTLVYTNKTKKDILLERELETFAKENANFKLVHTLTRHSEKDGEWTGLKGRITEEMLKQAGFPGPSEETLICYCGPAGFNKTVEELLAKMGYSKDMMHKF